ncbi:MAG: phosphoesterase [Rhodothermaceae bacterium]|nr:MAG: phosphoesterase [Rhodothermaceae bacterium]
MLNFVFLALGLAAGLFLLDYYVYRNWRRFAGLRRWARRTLPVYRVALWVMPFLLPAYFSVSRWWEVEPKLVRGLVVGVWVIYYLPRVVIAAGLLVKDAIRFVIWLFGWFQQRLLPAASSAPADAPGEPALDLSDMKRMPRRAFLQKLGWSAASVPFVIVGYGVFRTLYDFTLFRVEVPIPGLPRALDGLRIAQLSDLHAGSFFSPRPMHEAVALVRELQPDLVAVTGDFVNNDEHELDLILPALRTLRAELGVFGCLGNHDHYAHTPAVVDAVRATPLDLLVNENRILEIDGARLYVVGTDNTGFRQNYADLPAALDGVVPGDDSTTLLLAHDPSFWDTHVRPHHPEIDLMLCGHTHGGQLGIEAGPLRWSLARVVYPRWAGLYAEDHPGTGRRQFLYVNRGLGTVGPPVRLGIRPEITLLTLRRA